MKTQETKITKGQQYESRELSFCKMTVLKVLSNGMLLVKKTFTDSYGEVYLNYNKEIHSDKLRLSYKLVK